MLSFDNDDAGLEQPQLSDVKWYACYTRARHEKQVDRLLRQRDIESYLPLVSRARQWQDRMKVVSLPLFPSYVFARLPAPQVSRVLSVPGVATVVRSNGRPIAILAEEIANVRRFAEALSAGELETELASLPREGDRVRIAAGPFAGIHGMVIERRNRCRILVGLHAIGWGVQIQVDISEVIPLPV